MSFLHLMINSSPLLQITLGPNLLGMRTTVSLWARLNSEHRWKISRGKISSMQTCSYSVQAIHLEHVCMADKQGQKMPLSWDVVASCVWVPKGKNAPVPGCQPWVPLGWWPGTRTFSCQLLRDKIEVRLGNTQARPNLQMSNFDSHAVALTHTARGKTTLKGKKFSC